MKDKHIKTFENFKNEEEWEAKVRDILNIEKPE